MKATSPNRLPYLCTCLIKPYIYLTILMLLKLYDTNMGHVLRRTLIGLIYRCWNEQLSNEVKRLTEVTGSPSLVCAD